MIDESIKLDGLKEIDPTIREVSPMHITGRADISASKVTFHLNIKGYLILPCSRTLIDVHYPINVDTTETFLFNGYEYGEADEEVHQVKDDVIDLDPVFREILLLEVPMQVYCEDDTSQEGAPQSGKDWEVVQEQDQEKKVDPRLAGLAKFFDQNDSSE